MTTVNYFPVKFKDFMLIKSTGHYIIMYAILEDRIHLEMVVENAVFATQRFFSDIDEELEAKAPNYIGDKFSVFLRMKLNDVTFYRYFPLESTKEVLMNIKLFDSAVVKEITPGVYNSGDVRVTESEQMIKAYNGNDLIMSVEKLDDR